MFFYAQIDNNLVCFAVSMLSGEVIAPDMIRLDSMDYSLISKKWNGQGWEEVPVEPKA